MKATKERPNEAPAASVQPPSVQSPPEAASSTSSKKCGPPKREASTSETQEQENTSPNNQPNHTASAAKTPQQSAATPPDMPGGGASLAVAAGGQSTASQAEASQQEPSGREQQSAEQSPPSPRESARDCERAGVQPAQGAALCASEPAEAAPPSRAESSRESRGDAPRPAAKGSPPPRRHLPQYLFNGTTFYYQHQPASLAAPLQPAAALVAPPHEQPARPEHPIPSHAHPVYAAGSGGGAGHQLLLPAAAYALSQLPMEPLGVGPPDGLSHTPPGAHCLLLAASHAHPAPHYCLHQAAAGPHTAYQTVYAGPAALPTSLPTGLPAGLPAGLQQQAAPLPLAPLSCPPGAPLWLAPAASLGGVHLAPVQPAYRLACPTVQVAPSPSLLCGQQHPVHQQLLLAAPHWQLVGPLPLGLAGPLEPPAAVSPTDVHCQPVAGAPTSQAPLPPAPLPPQSIFHGEHFGFNQLKLGYNLIPLLPIEAQPTRTRQAYGMDKVWQDEFEQLFSQFVSDIVWTLVEVETNPNIRRHCPRLVGYDGRFIVRVQARPNSVPNSNSNSSSPPDAPESSGQLGSQWASGSWTSGQGSSLRSSSSAASEHSAGEAATSEQRPSSAAQAQEQQPARPEGEPEAAADCGSTSSSPSATSRAEEAPSSGCQASHSDASQPADEPELEPRGGQSAAEESPTRCGDDAGDQQEDQREENLCRNEADEEQQDVEEPEEEERPEECVHCEEPHEMRGTVCGEAGQQEATSSPKGAGMRFKMFIDSAKVRFCCDHCGHGWTSMKGRVVFWYELFELVDEHSPKQTSWSLSSASQGQTGAPSRPLASGSNLVGYCAYKLFGQQCDICKIENRFERPMWYPEEVTKVLNNLYNKIGQVYFGFRMPAIDRQRRAGKPKTSHNSSLCQACHDGVCTDRK